jgi:single-stranded-DNA-specific exonuclease
VTSPFSEAGRLPRPPDPEWALAGDPSPELVEALARELKLPLPLCRVLAVRGLTDGEGARAFLRPLLDHLHPPELLSDASLAASRIAEAIQGGETILVHGDYDVDGVCAVTLLTCWIRTLGGRVVPFVPHRLKDGYDLGPAGLAAAAEAGASLLVTCDCGTVAHDAVRTARDRGLDVIVTDHHTPGDQLPPALAVVNPARSDCGYPNPALSGTGVVFKLCQLLGRKLGRPLDELIPHLDLVALATVADLVPLRGENRVLTRYGLRALGITGRPGLQALKEVSGIEGDVVEAGQVAFGLAPRINAAGRMGAAADALRLLLTDRPGEARELARELDRLNRERRDEDERTLEQALAHLARDYDPGRDLGVVVSGEGWHPGVIGIVASRVVERIHRPVVLVSVGEGGARGSGRSVPGVDLHAAIQGCAEHLTRFGGHRQAAGMDLDPQQIPAFRDAFNRQVTRQLDGRPPRPTVRGDAPLALSEVNRELHHYLGYLGPFGMGNPRPVFWSRAMEVDGRPRTVGRGHLKLLLRDGGERLDAIGFGLADRVPADSLGRGPVDVLFQLRENEYRGVRSLQARIVDLRPSAQSAPPS